MAGDEETGEANGETKVEAYMVATCAGSSPNISTMAVWCTTLAPSHSKTGNIWTGFTWNMSINSLATQSHPRAGSHESSSLLFGLSESLLGPCTGQIVLSGFEAELRQDEDPNAPPKMTYLQK